MEDILQAIERVSRSVEFCETGTLDLARIPLDIDGVGSIELPLRPKGVRELLAVAQKAPYGKGTKTLVDTSVRNSLEVKASKIKLPECWDGAVQAAAQDAAARLGIPGSRVHAKLYKLLIYQNGGFFLPHRDSEKRKNMVGSLVVMLPNSFGGGELVVEHGESKKTFTFETAAEGQAAEYVAFYADCLHEVRRVTRGVRVCLHFNLMLRPQRKGSNATETFQPNDELAAALSHWTRTRPGVPLAYALQHQYTASGLKPELLKGNDRLAAGHLIAAAQATNCRVYFGQVSRHLQQFADDGSFGRERYWASSASVDIADLELGETYEDEVIVDGWKDARGKRVTMGELELDNSSLVSSVPLDQWKPTSHDYEGYTGNAGHTLDRWYHKSAVVVWAESHHFDVLVKMGIQPAADLWQRMREKLSKLSGAKLDDAKEDCASLARAIINGWPVRLYSSPFAKEEPRPWLDAFAGELPSLRDPDLLREFLKTVAQRDRELQLYKLVAAGCRMLDADIMADILNDHLSIEPPPTGHGRAPSEGLLPRDAAWLRKLASSRKGGGIAPRKLAKLFHAAAGRFCESLKSGFRHQSDDDVDTLRDLLQATLAAGDEKRFKQLLDVKSGVPDVFDLRAFDVETCSNLVKWADRRFDERPGPLDKWLAEIRKALQDATEKPPEPPSDFARPAKVPCDCACCRQLAEFLADPHAESGEIKARKDLLGHVQTQIRIHRLDAESEVNRRTRPFTLVLSKTDDSHKRPSSNTMPTARCSTICPSRAEAPRPCILRVFIREKRRVAHLGSRLGERFGGAPLHRSCS